MDKRHVFVVDNNASLLNSLDFILTAADYGVTTVTNGQEALEQILASGESDHRIDLIITDIRMPGLTGLQLIDELNRHEVHVPIVALTAYGSTKLTRELKQKGCVDCFEKTLNEAELVKRINSVLRRATPNKVSGSQG